MSLPGLTPRRIEKLENEIGKLREKNRRLRDALRWRKWPEEKPEDGQLYLLWITSEDTPDAIPHVCRWVEGESSFEPGWTVRWLPIPGWMITYTGSDND